MGALVPRRQTAALLATLVLASVVVAWTPSADGDVWWHLAAGREMVATHGWLFRDPFSVSAAGRPWANVHWLFQLGIFGAYQLGGLGALVVAKAALLATTAVILLRAQRRSLGAQLLFVVLFVGSTIAARHLLLLRPVMVTLLALALFFYLLERHRRQGGWASLAWLPVVQLVWANCQGLSALGPVMVAAYALAAASFAWFGQRLAYPFVAESTVSQPPRRGAVQLGVALLATLIAGGVTPYGLAGAALPATLLGRLLPTANNPYPRGVVENAPPLWLDQVGAGEFSHVKWYLLIVAIFFAFNARRLLLSHALVVLSLVALALFANRNVLLLYVVAAPILANGLAPALASVLGRARAATWPALAATLALASLLVLACFTSWREPTIDQPAPFRMPVESARLIAASPGEGRIFSADHQGGFLSWHLYPRFRPFVDTRWVLRSPDEFRAFLRVADEPERFDALDRAQHFRYVVLPVAYPERYLRLIAHLVESTEWQLIFTDGAEVLFVRRSDAPPQRGEPEQAWDLDSPETSDRILAGASVRYGEASPLFAATRLQLATLQLATGAYRGCARVLGAQRDDSEAALLARCFVAAGQLSPAERVGERLLASDDGDVRGLNVLAMVYARRGDRITAASFLRRALHSDPFDSEATSLLASMEGTRNDDP